MCPQPIPPQKKFTFLVFLCRVAAMPNDDLMTGLGLREPFGGYSVPVAAGVGSQALGPTELTFDKEKYSSDLLEKAKKEYGFIASQNPVVQIGKGEGYAETWPRYEEGPPEQPRPLSMAPGRVGVEVYKPESFTPKDLAAEMLHTDPYSRLVSNYIRNSLTSKQLELIKQSSADYEQSIRLGLGEDRAVQNAIDAAIRGYAVGQWPEQINAQIGYSPQQKYVLDSLVKYMRQGKL